MLTCTFFGHKDAPQTIEAALRETLKNLIERKNITVFYVGNHGQFDFYVRKVLRELVGHYPTIRYHVVLSYLPVHQTDCDHSDTLLPEGIETVPKRFAISWCNKWMLRRSDYVVTYVTHSWGGAAQFKALAEKQGKTVINLI